MKTLVLDDDPTGTQSASGVDVLLEWDADSIHDALSRQDSVYILTNTRALDEASAVRLLTEIRAQAHEVARRIGEGIFFVLRGDSTLRGHVFPETEVFAEPGGTIVFVPAFPDGGRVTVDGSHRVEVDGRLVPAHETEYAEDPVFPFTTAVLTEYVRQRSSRPPHLVSLSDLRNGTAVERLAEAAGGVALFDCETNDDIVLIADAIGAAREGGQSITVRSGSPLAAQLAGVASAGLLGNPLTGDPSTALMVCGSHTIGATRQLDPVIAAHGDPFEIGTDAALGDPHAEGVRKGSLARERVVRDGFALITTERDRQAGHGTLSHGERVMTALTSAVREAVGSVAAVVSKGGITSAEVARLGIGARVARVRGQILPGVSVWDLVSAGGRDVVYIVVPGNVGGATTLIDALDALGWRTGRDGDQR